MFDENKLSLEALYGYTIKKMPIGSIEVMRSTIENDVVPTVLVKIGKDERLTTSDVQQQLILFDTSECPVVMVWAIFAQQADWRVNQFVNWIPMHTEKQRELMHTIANTKWWHYVIFSGNMPSHSMMLQFGEKTQDKYRVIQDHVNRSHINNKANIDIAVDGLAGTVEAFMLGLEVKPERLM